jgi:hypothetical protein
LRRFVKDIEAQKGALERADRILKQVSESVLTQARQDGRSPTEDEREILAERRKQLRAVEKLSDDQCDELLRIGLGLRDATTVVNVVEHCPKVLEGTKDADKVALAVYRYFTGAESAAREQIEELRALPTSVPIVYRTEVIVLSAILKPSDMEEWVSAYGTLIKADEGRARSRLDAEVEKMKQDKASFERLGSAPR